MCCCWVTTVRPFIFIPEWWWLVCLFIPLQAEVRVGLNKTLAKHPGETSERYGKQLQFIFFPHLTSNCLYSTYDGGQHDEEGRDSFLQNALHRHPETTAALRKTVSLFQGTQNISLQRGLPSPLARAPAWVQTVCTARVLHVGADFLPGSQPQLRSSLLSSTIAPQWLWASHSVPQFPQL